MNYERKYKRLKKLLRMWTRAEVMARLGRFDNLEFINYAIIENELRDKIREKLFGSSNLVELGEKWNMLKDKKKKGK